MNQRNWDKELAKVDRQIGSMNDAELIAQTQAERNRLTEGELNTGAPTERDAAVRKARPATAAGAWMRLGLAALLGVAMFFWPYPARCGVGLFAYLLSAGVVTAAGVWSALYSWRSRTGIAHAASLATVALGLVLVAAQVLPRVGYALPSEARPAIWFCE